MKKVLITGSQGFIGSYVCQELLNAGYEVIGFDNYSKYGKIVRPHDSHKNFIFYEVDVRDHTFKDILLEHKPDIIIAGAAMIGGISYFHKYAYDLLATNERIMAATFDAAIELSNLGKPIRVIVISSSMVYENTEMYPTPEEEVFSCPVPSSTYGFQKLACEFFAKGAWEQYQIPYTIVRPFNCVGVGEEEALNADDGLMLSHVLPDLVSKILKGQKPLEILGEGNQVRCYTNGKDIGRAMKLIIEDDKAINQDFNISISEPTSVLELAQKVWARINPSVPFEYKILEPFHYDVQKRVPDVSKAKEVLGFEAEISLEDSIDEVIEYISKNLSDKILREVYPVIKSIASDKLTRSSTYY